jgi:Ca2+-binding EF-hand superfamily protein
MSPAELALVIENIGRKLPLKFDKPRDAFRPLDVERDGKITPSEMRSFLRGFGWGQDVADRFFSLLDDEGRGEVDYNAFMAHFAPVLGPAVFPSTRGRLLQVPPTAASNIDQSQLLTPVSSQTAASGLASRSRSGVAPSLVSTCLSEDLEKKLNEVAEIIGEKLRTKFRSGREALRPLNLRNDGQVTRSEMRAFFRSFCLPVSDADALFDALQPSLEQEPEPTGALVVGGPTVRYDDVVALLCPPSGMTATKPAHWRAMQDLAMQAPRPGEGLTVHRRLARRAEEPALLH